jgi:peroxiredoxin
MRKLSELVLISCFLLLFPACGQEPEIAVVGEPAPDFTLVDMKGRSWTLSDLRGQVVFINFWATWCSPCREEMPSMQQLYNLLPKDQFKMLAVLNKDDPLLAVSFAEKLGLAMPILNDRANVAGQKYGLTGVPETYIVDKQGVLREKFIGPAQWDTPKMRHMLSRYMYE